MLGPRDLPGGFRGPHRQSPQVTGVAVFLGHVSWDRMCSLWELGPLEKKRRNSVDQDSGHQNNCWSQTHLSPAPLTPQTAQVFDWRGSQWVASHPQYAGGHLRSSHVCAVYVLLRISQRPCSQGTVSFGWEDFLNLSTSYSLCVPCGGRIPLFIKSPS